MRDLWDALRPLNSAADAREAADRWRSLRSGS